MSQNRGAKTARVNGREEAGPCSKEPFSCCELLDQPSHLIKPPRCSVSQALLHGLPHVSQSWKHSHSLYINKLENKMSLTRHHQNNPAIDL